ncbi:hypothetical protein HDU67_001421, partial [Dinochytrium kinnereticum]
AQLLLNIPRPAEPISEPEIKDVIAWTGVENEIKRIIYEHIDEDLQSKFDSHEHLGTVSKPWEQFGIDLKYDKEHQSKVLRELFHTLKQEPKESPLQYGLRLEKLIGQAKTINRAIADTDAFIRFADSLIPDVLFNEALLISFDQKNINTLTGALTEMKRMEARRSIARLVHGTTPDPGVGVAFAVQPGN